ncbi:MAG: hypothetical protein LUG85_05935, partial [Clostridiales bacterium]|nr:hypothetical protein [Clostridiales bacterium]
EDEFVTYKILFACDKIAYIDAPMYAYYQNPNSTMHTYSSKRLAVLDALDEQIEFFYNNNYDNIAFTRIRRAVYTSKSFYEVVNDKKTKFYLKRYTRKKIIKYRKHLKELFKNYKEIYEFAFPNFMTLYWYFIVLLKKLKIKKN